MYIPAAFQATDTPALHALMHEYSFATLVTTHEGTPFATHIPVLLDADRGPYGTLRGHLARPNPQWQPWADAHSEPGEALVIFQGPHAYISPTWYKAPTASVPTWNYAVVHAYGVPRLLSEDELRVTLADSAAQYEGEDGWNPALLPETMLTNMIRGIVGFEIQIIRLEGKFKMSQNRSAADREQAIQALRTSTDSLAIVTADMMEHQHRASF
jgi:transcriptional regulator